MLRFAIMALILTCIPTRGSHFEMVSGIVLEKDKGDAQIGGG